MLSDGFVWKKLLRWRIRKNHRPLVQWACVRTEPSQGFHLVIMQPRHRKWVLEVFCVLRGHFYTPQQQHCFICQPGYTLLIWGKKIMKNSFTFSLLGNIAELLSLLTLSLWNMISFSAEEKPQQPVTWRQNGSVKFSQEKHGGQVRRVKSFEVFWTVKVSHKDTRWSWIKKEWRKRRSDSPCLIAGWSPRLILDPLSQFHHCNHDQRHTRGEQPRCEAGCTFKCVLNHNPCYVKDAHSLDSFGDVIPHHLRYMDSSQEIHFWWATAVM